MEILIQWWRATISITKSIKAALVGVAVGDAICMLVEFKSRAEISSNPITDMRAYGTYDLAASTFSDDSSLTFYLAEAYVLITNWKEHLAT